MAIYLDHAATSPMLPEVFEAYTGALSVVGNPSSIHSQGQQAKRMLEEAREHVAASLGAESVEVVFTGGGTEAVNLGIKGLYWARNAGGSRPPAELPRPRIVVPRGEHHATVDAVEWLAAREGAVIDWIPVDGFGRVDLTALDAALDEDVALVTALWANNEVGTLQPIHEIVALATAHGIPVHADAIAAYGYVPLSFRDSGLAAMSVSAHKIGGPVGIAALLVSRSAVVEPLIHGGNQQRARSGTQDAAGAVAFGVAAQAASARLGGIPPVGARLAEAPLAGPAPLAVHATGRTGDAGADTHVRLRELCDRLIAGVLEAVPSAVLRGDPVDRLPGNAHFTFPGCEGDSLLFLLDVAGFSVSTGSACQAGVPEASHVLLAMGLTEEQARGALRITLGHDSTQAEVDAFVAALPAAVDRARTAGFADRVTTLGR